MGAQTDVAKRRHRSKQERRRIVEESLKAGVSVAELARTHSVRPNQIFHWRRLYREGQLGATTQEFLPVRITEATSPVGRIQLEFGKVRLCLEGPVDHQTLSIILDRIAR
jgi:transposase